MVKITAKVSSRIRLRCGKSGTRASAAASETDPRMPHQLMIIRLCQVERRSRCDSRRSSARMTKTAVWLQISRVTMTTRLTATHHHSSSPAGWPDSPSRMSGSCSPISTNSSALSRNVRISHTA